MLAQFHFSASWRLTFTCACERAYECACKCACARAPSQLATAMATEGGVEAAKVAVGMLKGETEAADLLVSIATEAVSCATPRLTLRRFAKPLFWSASDSLLATDREVGPYRSKRALARRSLRAGFKR
eukprot:6195170-Pleurochrysis_carterae.AAC.4